MALQHSSTPALHSRNAAWQRASSELASSRVQCCRAAVMRPQKFRLQVQMVKRLRFYVVLACTSEKTKNHNFDLHLLLLEILEIKYPREQHIYRHGKTVKYNIVQSSYKALPLTHHQTQHHPYFLSHFFCTPLENLKRRTAIFFLFFLKITTQQFARFGQRLVGPIGTAPTIKNFYLLRINRNNEIRYIKRYRKKRPTQ